MTKRRVVLLVLDSCGCGGAADAADYGDAGADTLGHTAHAVGGLELPHLRGLGLGNLTEMRGVPAAAAPGGAFGRMNERSAGKDTTTGHWELSGLVTTEPFRTFTDGFPSELIEAFVRETGRGVLGNKVASGTDVIEELGPEQRRTGAWIVYTSVDSVFQVAAHEDVIPLDELYAACRIARRLCDPYRIGRVIARPFRGEPGSLERTYDRHDYAMPPHAETVLDRLAEAGIPIVGVGKIGDIFCGQGIAESIRSAGNVDGMHKTIERLRTLTHGLLFTNLVDFDSRYGHRRDPAGFARALRQFDEQLPALVEQIGNDDLLMITADHGNDPTHRGTDHTREQVPLLVYGPKGAAGVDLGARESFCDVAATLAEAFGQSWSGCGRSFISEIGAST
jgi:phosphopentomutase